jgi:hypothetical protein
MPSPNSFSSVISISQYALSSLISILAELTLSINHTSQTFDIIPFSLDRSDYSTKIIVEGKGSSQKPFCKLSISNFKIQ